MQKFRVLTGFSIMLASLMAILTLLPSQMKAQSTYGSIVGTVTDASGAVVPGAKVTITNAGTSEARSARTDSSGNFSVVNLLPAVYKVEVQTTGYKRYLREGIGLEVGATLRVEAALQVGAVTETVQVSTAAPLLQTDSSSVNQEIEGAQVQEMPLNGRNTMGLLALAPGVVPQGSTTGGTGQNQNGSGHTNNAGWGWFQIGGTLAGESATYIDGAPDNVLAGNTVGLVMTQDAVQEFNVATNNVSADYGRFGGGVVNMASKSGTNKFHGSTYEYLRNSFFNSNDYFNKANQIAGGEANHPLKFNQNQYGAAVGGPIKKDKAFFHFTWEGFKSSTGSAQPTSVPTADMQNGIFDGEYITQPQGVMPDTQCINYYDAGGGLVTPNSTGSNVAQSVISSGCVDAMAAIIRGYYPSPNATPSASNGFNNFYVTPLAIDKQNQYNARIDYALSSKQQLFGRYTYWNLNDNGEDVLGDANGWKTSNSTSVNMSHQVVLGDTYNFSPTTVLDVRLGYLREFYPSGLPESLGTDPSKFPNTYYSALANEMSVHLIPVYGFGQGAIHNLWGVGRAANYELDYYNTYSLGASLIHIMGKHSVKVGAEIRRMEDSGIGNNNNSNSGNFTFNNTTGDEWADFLFGNVGGGMCFGGGPPHPCAAIGVGEETGAYSYYQGYYVTDNWTATHNLTLNLGLRYELPGGIYEKHNLATVLLPSATDAGVKGILALVNSSLYSNSSTVNVKHDLFAPRVGFAYRLGNNMSARGGYGISYLPVDIASGVFPTGSSVNSSSTSCNPGAQMANCFTSLIQPPARTYNGLALVNYLGIYNSPHPNNLSGPVPDQSYPYVQQWNLAFSRQMKGDLMVDVGYVGSKGTHMPASGSNLNQLADSYFSQGNALNANAPCAAMGGEMMSVGQCARPYPYYGSVSDGLAFNADTIYHALQVKGEKRFKSGGTLMANYTWGKTIGDTDSGSPWLEFGPSNGGQGGAGGYQDYNNMKGERSVLSFDVPQRAVISYVLSLPFGRGQMWGKDATGVLNGAISGWGVNGITTFQHGFHIPLSDNDPTQLGNFGAAGLRPNVVPGCDKKSPVSGNARIGEWFNPACFTAVTDGFSFGNEPRVDANLFDQGIDNFDFSMMKTTNITEGTNVQFRAEFFNLFNRVQFAPPDTQQGSEDFGKILSQANQPREIQFSLRVNF